MDIKVGGKLLQTNKKWSHLKQSQKEWISEIAREEYGKYTARNKKKPHKHEKDAIVDVIYDRVNDRDIWIPFYEAKTAVYKIIDRLNRIVEFDVVDGEVVFRTPAKKSVRNRLLCTRK